jgi:hypothetical protein
MSTDARVQRLLDIEEIKRLKARYFRSLDLKDWDDLGDVFTEDAHVDYSLPGSNRVGRAAVIEFIRAKVGPLRTVHHGHMPEIEVSGDTARGVWAMFDMVEGPEVGGPVMRGYGHYHEEYVRDGARWRISRLRLTRLRTDRGVKP